MQTHEKIRLFRELNRWSQEDMAEKLDLTTGGYSKIERGESQINLQRLQQIADVFNVNLFDLMPDTNISIQNNEHCHNYQFNYNPPTGLHHRDLQHEIDKLKLIIQHKDEIIQQKDIENQLLKDMIETLKLKM